MTKLQESFVKRIGWALTAALTLSLPGLAWAQNAIRAIQSSQQAGVDVVRIEFSCTATKDPLVEQQAAGRMRMDRRQPHDRTVAGHEIAVELSCCQLLGCDLAGECEPSDR